MPGQNKKSPSQILISQFASTNLQTNKSVEILRAAIATAFLIITAILCLYSIKNAAFNSQDFQWSGAKALLHGRNPYLEYLGQERNAYFIKSQAPNYLQHLYILFLPFALLPEVAANITWGFCNAAMLMAAASFLMNYMRVPRLNGLLYSSILLIMLSSFPARNAIGNGQASIFTLFCFSAGIYMIEKKNACNWPRSIPGSLLYGLGYAKYSFAPVFATYFLNLRNIRDFVVSIVPSLLGVLTFGYMFRDQYAISGPLQVSSKTMVDSAGLGDLLAFIVYTNGGISGSQFKFLGYLLVFVSVAIVWLIRNIEINRRLAITAIISLSFVTHLGYDYCFLLIPLAFAFSPASTFIDRFAILIHYIWIGYILRGLYAAGVSLSWTWVTPVTFFLNIGLLLILALPAVHAKYKYSWHAGIKGFRLHSRKMVANDFVIKISAKLNSPLIAKLI